MIHLIISREYPPAPYAHGGIGTYVQQIARLFVERGETVHVIAEQWDRAPQALERLHAGRLIIHRVPLARPRAPRAGEREDPRTVDVLEAMAASALPVQGFSWQAALLAEWLIDTAGIDVVEGQDYEAPLYYLMVRRSVGLGPARRPPCVVHLHGPWELVCRYNDRGLASDYDLTLARLEAHVIRAADALLCPSDYLARQAASLYGVDRAVIERIPYPLSDVPIAERSPDTWRNGTVLYVGRMELRKGVLEWIEAAVSMAAERPDLRFEFVGADTTITGEDDGASVRAALEQRVPATLKDRFAFHDAEPRPAILDRLARAQLVVVPSRWDNFPNTGIEAMSSGLPVLASPEGGLAEIIEDGRTGWMAASNRPADLLAALRRSLDTPADVRARMGSAAAEAIRTSCSTAETVNRHLEFRRRVVAAGALRSGSAPESGSLGVVRTEATSAAGSNTASIASSALDGRGLVVAVLDAGDGQLGGCLDSLASQSRRPAQVLLACGPGGPTDPRWSHRALEQRGWRLVEAPSPVTADLRHAALRALRERDDAVGLALVESVWRLAPTFVDACQRVLERDERVGLVSSWFAEGGPWRQVRLPPAPAWPYQWLADDVSPCSVFRPAALQQARALHGELGPDASTSPTDFALAVLAGGWRAVTYPAPLSWRGSQRTAGIVDRAAIVENSFRTALLEKWASRPEADSVALQTFLGSVGAHASGRARSIRGSFTPQLILGLSFDAQVRLVGRALRNPGYAIGWIGWHARRAWREAVKRLGRSS